ncbi:iron hydrogenase assembly [Micractinium conductrix]|uniref:Iron hydrogenase assembly n=1 Tax=Micractinium conductrix TaxID=554055 RepID=A0A2P6VCP7_9CHLO|nr:iron hydrogenase assembly [Micractinium conductrix]|eukprot:PSC71854.1 iron hydrogenase assembly [Micractinium conductrix]
MLRAALLGGGGGGAVAPLAAQLAASVAVPLLRRAFTAGSLPRRSLAAVENLFREMEGRKALPWENAVTAEEAAKVLGSFWGSSFRPGDVLDLTVNQMEALLSAITPASTRLPGAAAAPADAERAGLLDSALFAHAESVSNRFFGKDVYYRGIVEFSNVCENDCGYCGIRKHQRRARRYTMPADEVVEVADWAFKHRMGTLMLQSGELNTPQRLKYLVEVVQAVKARTQALDAEQRSLDPSQLPKDTTGLGLCVALSVGELPREQYQTLRDAGADRYLLRIESSNPELYASIHPPAQKWENRVRCLRDLKDIGFMIGTGVMVGLPGQTLRDLAGDVMFFRDLGADMIGMGPYITEAGTPVADMWAAQFEGVDKGAHMKEMLTLTTRMNALARVTLGNVNIAATTALQAIDAVGREIALRRGANVLMPILTPTKFREHYTLYEGKPCITDTAEECQKCLNARLSMVDKKLRPGVWGDPPSYRQSVNPVPLRGAATLAGGASRGTGGTGGGGGSSGGAARGLHTRAGAAAAAAAQPAAAATPGGPAKGSDAPRTNIGIFGCMNAGKSSLMNRITRSETSIVDSTPGTTADTKVVLMELHDVGPAKLFDTAGIDEAGELGEKKRRKVLGVLKETDVAVVVLDAAKFVGVPEAELPAALEWELLLLGRAAAAGSTPLLVYNTKLAAGAGRQQVEGTVPRLQAVLNPSGSVASTQLELNRQEAADSLAGTFQAVAAAARQHDTPRSLPDEFLSEDSLVFLNIPMDAETPSLRLLRPQALVQEEAIRHYAATLAYRMNLAHARSSDPALVERERARFLRALQPVLAHTGPKIIVTDSQAVDILHPWTLDPATGEELVPFTTFSIAMIHRQSRGQLPLFVQGLEAFKQLKAGDRVLVAEACNHNRITDICNDIGMVQIPDKVEAQGGRGVVVEHAFGREFPELDEEGGGLASYALAIHCGGCMIDQQKIRARLLDLKEAGVPVTNYGLLLSYAHSPAALERAMKPWGLSMQS